MEIKNNSFTGKKKFADGRIHAGKKIILTISLLAFFCLCANTDLLYFPAGYVGLTAGRLCLIIITVILLICIWALPDFRFAGSKDGRYLLAALLFDLIPGYSFYLEWCSSWDAQNVASKMGITMELLVVIIAAIGVVIAIPFVASLIKTFLSETLLRKESKGKFREVFNDKVIFVVGLIIACGGFCVMIISCFSPDIWVDEAFTLSLIEFDYKEMIGLTAEDCHPPLYYIILKFAVDGVHLFLPGISVITLAKLVSVIPYVLLFVLCVTRIRKNLGGLYVSGVSAAALVGMPLLAGYGIEMRMYAWGMFFVTAALLFAHAILCKQKIRAWIGLVVFSLCAGYSHYFALAAVAVIYLCLLIRYLIKERINLLKWLIAAIVSIVGYLPWLFVFMEQAQTVSGSFWIEEITADTIYSYISDVFGTEFYLLLALTVLVSAAGLLLKRRADHTLTISLMAVLVPFGTVGAGIAASLLIRPVFVIRYVVPGLFCLWLGVFIAVNMLFNSNARKVIALIIFLTAVVNIGFFASEQYSEKIQSEETLEFLESTNNAVYISDSSLVVRTVEYWSDGPVYLWDNDYLTFYSLWLKIYTNLQGNISSPEELMEILDSGADLYFAEYEEGVLDTLLSNTSIEAVEIGEYRIEYNVTVYQLTVSAD